MWFRLRLKQGDNKMKLYDEKNHRMVDTDTVKSFNTVENEVHLIFKDGSTETWEFTSVKCAQNWADKMAPHKREPDLMQDIAAEAIFRFNHSTAGILSTVTHAETSSIKVDFPVYTTIDKAVVGVEGVEVDPIITPAVTVTVVENLYATTISDLAIMDDEDNTLSESVGRMVGGKLSDALISNISKEFEEFESIPDHNDKSGVTLDNFFNAIRTLVENGADQDDLYAVLTPEQYWGPGGLRSCLAEIVHCDGCTCEKEVEIEGLGKVLVNGENMINPEAREKGIVNLVSGVPILVVQGIKTGAMYSPQAIGLASSTLISVKSERNEALRGYDLIGVGRWKAVTLVEELGVKF